MATPKCSLIFVALIVCMAAFGQTATGEPLVDPPTHWKQSIERPTRSWDYDGKRILGHIGYDICLWDAATGKLLHRMEGHKEHIHAVQLSPDGNHAFSSSWIGPGPMLPLISRDTRTILWNLGPGRERDSFESQVAGEFSPDGSLIVTFSQRPSEIRPEWGKAIGGDEVRPLGIAGSFDNAAVWETFTGRQLVKAKLDEHSDPKRDALHFSPDGRRFVHVGTDAVLYDTSDGREVGRVDLRFKRFRRYTSSGALASGNTTLTETWFKLTDIESSREIQRIEHDLPLRDDFAWTHDGSKVVAIPSSENAIKILDMESEKMITGAKTGPYPKTDAIVSPDNSRLAIAWRVEVDDGDVERGLGLYQMSTGKEIARIKLAKFAQMLGFSPDGKTLLVGGSEFVIYNADSGEEIRTLKLDGDPLAPK